ncbi:hypothetical protein, partial [Rhizobium tibeticum]
MPVRLTALKKILCFLFSYLALDKGKDSTKEGCVVDATKPTKLSALSFKTATLPRTLYETSFRLAHHMPWLDAERMPTVGECDGSSFLSTGSVRVGR